MVRGCTLIDKNLVKVPSEETPNLTYIVDTVMGKCECSVGSTGAPCKHQFIVWASLKMGSTNFMPFFCKEERMRFAEIAIGEAAHQDATLFDDLRVKHYDIQVSTVENLSTLDILNPDEDLRYYLYLPIFLICLWKFPAIPFNLILIFITFYLKPFLL